MVSILKTFSAVLAASGFSLIIGGGLIGFPSVAHATGIDFKRCDDCASSCTKDAGGSPTGSCAQSPGNVCDVFCVCKLDKSVTPSESKCGK